MTARNHRRASPLIIRSGHYIVRLIPKGWAVPAHVTVASDVIQVTMNGSQVTDTWYASELPDMLAEATMTGELFAHPLFRVILFGEPCDEAEYRYRLALKDWAAENAPWHPCLHPDKPIDLNLLPATDF